MSLYTFLRGAGNARRGKLHVQLILTLDTAPTYEDTAKDNGVIAIFRGEFCRHQKRNEPQPTTARTVSSTANDGASFLYSKCRGFLSPANHAHSGNATEGKSRPSN